MTESAQPQGVIDTLTMCFSIAPAIFILVGFFFVLFAFPMRDREDHAKLIVAIDEHKKGLVATDPYYGNKVAPPKASHNIPKKLKLALEHFFPMSSAARTSPSLSGLSKQSRFSSPFSAQC